ncbi:hypothetical protein B296_00042229, partial [Ensete ventricosum]
HGHPPCPLVLCFRWRAPPTVSLFRASGLGFIGENNRSSRFLCPTSSPPPIHSRVRNSSAVKSSRSPMAPSAAILFLSYQQWKPKPSRQPLPGAPPPPPPAAAATSFLVKFSRNPASRPSSPPAAAQAKAKASNATTKRHPTTEDKFQEALELGCWSL